MKRPSEAHILMQRHLEELGLKWRAEEQFAIGRKWRLDFFAYQWREKLFRYVTLGIEIDGGTRGSYDKVGRWQPGVQGRHNRPIGFEKDLEKLNECAIRGISVLRFTPQQVKTGEAKETIRRWLEAR